MKKIFTLCFLFFLSNSYSQNLDKAFNDFPIDSKFPAFNKEIVLTSKGDSIASYAFIASGKQPKETIILLHGLPGNDNQFDIAQSLRRTGRNVIHFNYRGSWGSQGEFLYSNCLEDVNEVINYFTSKEVSGKLRINTKSLVLIGRSFGGGIALIQGSKNTHVKKIIAISSMNAGSEKHPIHHQNKYDRWIAYFKKQIMLNITPAKFLQDVYDHKKLYDVVSYKNQLKSKKVLIIEDTDNNQHWIQQLENVELNRFDSDHNFISNRIKLTKDIIDWLDKN
jgi:predicted alpha/beta-fold hydrolase